MMRHPTPPIDYFHVLQSPRQPWLDPEQLKNQYLKLSSASHPDRTPSASEAESNRATQATAELNAAYACLREPRTRLHHLLEIERGLKPANIQQVPAHTSELFLEVGQLCRQIDLFLDQKKQAASPLAKAQLFSAGLDWSDQLQQLIHKIEDRRETLLSEIQKINADWTRPPQTTVLDQIERIYVALSFLDRWNQQLRERSVQLAL